MSYTLRAKNKEVEDFDIGWVSWMGLLRDTGAGFAIYYGQGIFAGSYYYVDGNCGSPMSNDGYKVSSRESKIMATCVKGYIFIAKAINKEIEEKRERLDSFELSKEIPISTIQKFEKFAEFAEKSKGFRIY